MQYYAKCDPGMGEESGFCLECGQQVACGSKLLRQSSPKQGTQAEAAVETMGLISWIIGIIGMILAVVVSALAGIVLGLIAIVLGSSGRRKHGPNASFGFMLGGLSVLLGVVFIVIWEIL